MDLLTTCAAIATIIATAIGIYSLFRPSKKNAIHSLSGLHALKTDRDGLTQLVEDLGSELNLDQTAPTTYQRQINRVLDVPPAAPPDTPMTHGEDRTHALSPEAQDLLVTAASDRQNGAIFATQSFAGLSISVGEGYSQKLETRGRKRNGSGLSKPCRRLDSSSIPMEMDL